VIKLKKNLINFETHDILFASEDEDETRRSDLLFISDMGPSFDLPFGLPFLG